MKKKLTPWFPGGTYPTRKGFYIASVSTCNYYRYWDGRSWFYGGYTLEDAFMRQEGDPIRWPLKTPLRWRGLAEKP